MPDASDDAPQDRFLCHDLDEDLCDECAEGAVTDPSSDGPDLDGDGSCDRGDPDDDNDGLPDLVDAFPRDALEWLDTDHDGLGDNADPDDDGDGVSDGQDNAPLDRFLCHDLDADQCDECTTGAVTAPLQDGPDHDQDGLCDVGDPDDDGDSVADGLDSAPFDRFLCHDTDGDTCDECGRGAVTAPSDDGADLDGDGLCDVGDSDQDGDGVANLVDAFPQDAQEWLDTDGDGQGDNADQDDDNDGLEDDIESGSGVWVDASTDTGTNPLEPDTDGDGLLDGVETNIGVWVSDEDTGTDPLNSDTDNDGLHDAIETNTSQYLSSNATGTDPNNADTDGDNVPDGLEVNHLTDPNYSESVRPHILINQWQNITSFNFNIMKYEVSVADYRLCVLSGSCSEPSLGTYFDESKANHPVNYVTWNQAATYCTWLGGELPSEYLWELAARGTSPSGESYPWGSDDRAGIANTWWYGNPLSPFGYPDGPTTPVGWFDGTKRNGFQTQDDQSPYGVRDIVGNVREWTVNDIDISNKLVKGGGCGSGYDVTPIDSQGSFPPTLTSYNIGFRCVSWTTDSYADIDNDGVPNALENDTGIWFSENARGTNPYHSDSDHDGLLDGSESNTGVFISLENTGSNPNKVDTDDDEIDDINEILAGTDPNAGVSSGNPWINIPGGIVTRDGGGRVYVNEFRMKRFETSSNEYSNCVTAGVCSAASAGAGCNYEIAGKEKYPINCITWYQMRQYCQWIGGDLPTSDQWEFAARGEDGRIYPWGNDQPSCSRANTQGCSTGPFPVDTLSAGTSPFGIYNMVGNVGDWTKDVLFDSVVVRGSSWGNPLISAEHPGNTADPMRADPNDGFRCAAPALP